MKDWGYWLKHIEEMNPYNTEFVDFLVDRIYKNTHIKYYRDGSYKIKTYTPNHVEAPWLWCLDNHIRKDYELLKMILRAKKERTKEARELARSVLRRKVLEIGTECYKREGIKKI